jgi:hypothetical protein
MSRSVSAERERVIPTEPDAGSLVAGPVMAAALGATSIVVGLLWDISWHRSIGRDTFWTPAHMAIYLGGLVAGLAAAALVLRASFGPPGAAASAVSVGPFRGPLGAWLMIWGAVAMLASAPFDDWWHNAYGLDVKIVSPPHAVLAAGMFGIVAGAMLLAVSVQNRSSTDGASGWRLLHLYASGVLLTLAASFTLEYTFPLHQHSGLFYEVAAGIFPFFLLAGAISGRGRFPATFAALVYMGLMGAMDWILPLFPAEPRLAPIFNPITRMVPFSFPLLLVFPALAMDFVLARWGREKDGRLAVAFGLVFLGVFLLVQWPFASFQMTPLSRNWFFVGDRYWSYWFHPESPGRYVFSVQPERLGAARLFVAAVLAIASARAGLALGRALSRVRR